MKILFVITALFLIFASCGSKNNNEENKKETNKEKNNNSLNKPVVVAYVAGWKKTDISTIQAEKLTHINYAFANIIEGKVCFGSETDTIDNAILNENDLIELQKLKEKNPELKILVSVGGWTWSSNFSDAAFDENSRQKFAASAADFVQKYNLDGIDLDWEYPNQIGAGNTYRPDDIENFTLLLKEVRKELDKIQKPESSLWLTIASGGDSAYITNTNLSEASKYLDFINIMGYDFYNGLHEITGHHANLFPAEHDPAVMAKKEDVRSLSLAVERHLNAGVPKEKIVVGVPFYGRKWDNLEPNGLDGLFVESETVGIIIPYKEIIADFLENPDFKYFFDSTAMAPYLYSEKRDVFISFENPFSLKEKLKFVKQQNLRGVMFWEYSKDKDSELLNTIFENLLKK
ncbi:MAG: glycoside hydrolase family 18 protein [Bacteroidales bacterium]|nr:glycoside hydrolase family 18 protein [Bacteroidales bacterium]